MPKTWPRLEQWSMSSIQSHRGSSEFVVLTLDVLPSKNKNEDAPKKHAKSVEQAGWVGV
jgi:hypothetical protein